MATATATKKVKLDLEGLDGNAFVLMGAFSRQARKEGWTKDEIEFVMTQCRGGDYDNLLRVLMDHCESSDE
jgi:tripartite-type tricarboxylate transporter receptor subunit TctC